MLVYNSEQIGNKGNYQDTGFAMTTVSKQPSRKTKVILVGIYLPGIYPAAEDDVVSRLLATSFLMFFSLQFGFF